MNSLNKKGILSIVALTSLLLLSVPAGYGQDVPWITVDPMHTDVDPVGETFSVWVWLNVSMANVTGLSLWQIKLGYNTTVLNATGAGLASGYVLEGAGINFVDSVEDADGYILVMAAVMDVPADVVNVTMSKPLCHVNFTSTAIGNSTLELLDIDMTGGTYLLNSTGGMIPLDTVDGDVTVIPEFLPFAMLAVMMTVTAALVLLKKRWSTYIT